jgi:hypothetical protein
MVLLVHASLSRNHTLSMLPSVVPGFYQKKMITVHHVHVRGVALSCWRFVHYTRWIGISSYLSIMTSISLPCMLQTALSDANGATRGAPFEPQMGMAPPTVIGVILSSPGQTNIPVFSGDAIGPDLSAIPFRDVHIWVRAHSVHLKAPILWQARTSELMAVWDYEGKLESRPWSWQEGEQILGAQVSAPLAKMLRCICQAVCNAILQKLQGEVPTGHRDKASAGLKGLTCDIAFSPLEEKASTQVVAV